LSHSAAAALNYAVRRWARQSDRGFLFSTTATSLQQDLRNFAKTEYDDIISVARLQEEEECNSDCFRKFYSRRKSRWWQRRTLRDPWKLLRP